MRSSFLKIKLRVCGFMRAAFAVFLLLAVLPGTLSTSVSSMSASCPMLCCSGIVGPHPASAGGPIVRDETFLFANFEQTRRNDSNVITISPANVTAINNRLNQISFRGPRIETGIAPGGYDVSNFFARVDHRLNSKNSLAATYTLYDLGAIISRTVGGLNAVSRGTNMDNRDHTINTSLVTTLSTRTLNEFRFQYRHSSLDAPVSDEIGPAVNISGVANLGTATFSPLARKIDLFQASDSISTVRGSHSLKAGFDFLLNRVDILFPGALQGVYTFTSLNNFLNNNYGSFQQAFGAPSQFQSNPNFGLFVQDEWKPRANLTFNLGLRYYAQLLPNPIQTDKKNFSPRIGISYSPGNHKTVVRASYGIYFERIPLRATNVAFGCKPRKIKRGKHSEASAHRVDFMLSESIRRAEASRFNCLE